MKSMSFLKICKMEILTIFIFLSISANPEVLMRHSFICFSFGKLKNRIWPNIIVKLSFPNTFWREWSFKSFSLNTKFSIVSAQRFRISKLEGNFVFLITIKNKLVQQLCNSCLHFFTIFFSFSLCISSATANDMKVHVLCHIIERVDNLVKKSVDL